MVETSTCDPILSDHAQISKNSKFLQLFSPEDSNLIIFSDKVKKFNYLGWRQERLLIITQRTIYYAKPDQVKRSLPIQNLAGISKALFSKKGEFTLHMADTYDTRFQSPRREQMISVIQEAYF